MSYKKYNNQTGGTVAIEKLKTEVARLSKIATELVQAYDVILKKQKDCDEKIQFDNRPPPPLPPYENEQDPPPAQQVQGPPAQPGQVPQPPPPPPAEVPPGQGPPGQGLPGQGLSSPIQLSSPKSPNIPPLTLVEQLAAKKLRPVSTQVPPPQQPQTDLVASLSAAMAARRKDIGKQVQGGYCHEDNDCDNNLSCIKGKCNVNCDDWPDEQVCQTKQGGGWSLSDILLFRI